MPIVKEGQVMDQAMNDRGNEQDLFDLDVQVSKSDGGASPQITSYSLCTPGCGYTGSFNSYCC